MTNQRLDVLIVESHPGVASSAATELTEAGHRLHYCHDTADHGFRCRGLHTPSTCPLERGVDVAFVARDGISPQPSAFEEGVRCAIRAEVPLVEQGPEHLDPFGPWVAERVEPGADIDAACRRAANRAETVLEAEIRRRVRPLLTTLSIDPDDVRCSYDPDGTDLTITLRIPIVVSDRVKQALAVRVLDALRGTGRTFGRVRVNVTADPPT